MKNLKSLLALVLALLAVLTLAACGEKNGEDDPAATSDAAATEPLDTTPDTSDLYDENGYLKDDLDSYGLDYKDTVVHILFDKAQMTKTYTEATNGDIVNDALYERLEAVEEQLSVKLDFIALEGAWNKRAEFAQEVDRVYQAGTKDYDLVCAYNLTPPTMAVNGTLTNIMELDYIDLEKPWWPKQLLSQSVYKGKLFFAADNCSWNVIRNMQVIVYNKALVENSNIPDPMQTVIDGKWTMEVLTQYIDGLYQDLDGSQTSDVDKDQFGLASDTKPRLDGYFFAAGLHITELDGDGVPHFALNDEKVSNFVTYMQNLYTGNPNVVLDSAQYKMFKEQRAVFYETAIAIADQKLEFGYGMLPIPKFNTEQEGYITGMSNTYDMWCIPKQVNDANMSAAVLEALASQAYRKVCPMYFETMLKMRYASSGNAGIVFDIIRDGMVFDFGYVYGNNFPEAPFITVRNCLTDANASWTTAWKGRAANYDKLLSEMLGKLELN